MPSDSPMSVSADRPPERIELGDVLPLGTKIYADDALLRNVQEADVKEEWADVLVLHDWRNAFVTERIHGKIRIDGRDFNTARSRIEELFASLQQDKDFQELRATTHLRAIEYLSAKSSRLRADQMTPEEARYVLTGRIPLHRMTDALLEKLRRISGLGSQ